MFVFIKTFLIGFCNVFFLLSIIIQITVKKKKKTGEYFLRLCLERSHLALILLINEACILEIPMQNFPKRKLLSTKVENKIEPNVQEFSTWINKHDPTVRPQNFDQLQRTITGKKSLVPFLLLCHKCSGEEIEKVTSHSSHSSLLPRQTSFCQQKWFSRAVSNTHPAPVWHFSHDWLLPTRVPARKQSSI